MVDRVPEELWMKLHNVLQESVTKAVPKKNKCKKQNGYLRREALQTAEERREVKGTEKRKYISI